MVVVVLPVVVVVVALLVVEVVVMVGPEFVLLRDLDIFNCRSSSIPRLYSLSISEASGDVDKSSRACNLLPVDVWIIGTLVPIWAHAMRSEVSVAVNCGFTHRTGIGIQLAEPRGG